MYFCKCTSNSSEFLVRTYVVAWIATYERLTVSRLLVQELASARGTVYVCVFAMSLMSRSRGGMCGAYRFLKPAHHLPLIIIPVHSRRPQYGDPVEEF